jgi:hypothetical protein
MPNKKWYWENRKSILEKDKLKREENPEEYYRLKRESYQRHKDTYQNSYLIRTFGITLEQKIALFYNQGEKCAICLRPLVLGKGSHLDHNHITGKIRGVLCRACNHLIGNAGESEETLQRAIIYLKQHNLEELGGHE